jgi:purine-nucleoside phosphorylase
MNQVQETLEYLKTKTKLTPKIGLVLGSGLGAFVNDMAVEVSIPFGDIPHFGKSSVEGHSGNLIFGHVNNIPVVVQQGRLHFYEGHSVDSVVFPVRVMGVLGVKNLILTNSAGGCGDGMKAGDFMVINDHINLMGINPLLGPNLKELGPRFPDMTEAYDRNFVLSLLNIFKRFGISHHQGVYTAVTGPSYETPAEVRYLKSIGSSAVGMSTVPETLAAHHMGIKVAGISCITNLAAGISKQKLAHTEVTETAKRVEANFSKVLKEFISTLA